MSRDRFNFLSYLMDDDEDDEEDDTLLVMILASVPLEKKRAFFHVRDRLEWDRHVAQLQNEDRVLFLRCTGWIINHSPNFVPLVAKVR
jgi:hypothetical protein